MQKRIRRRRKGGGEEEKEEKEVNQKFEKEQIWRICTT